MPLAALIVAGAADADVQVAGQSRLEFQARRAVAAGARHIVFAVDTLPAPLLAITDTLRSEGLSVGIARSANELNDLFHPDERILLISASDRLLSDPMMDELATTRQPTILAVPAHFYDDRFERMDMNSRWSGFALIGARAIRAMPPIAGDWDLGSTLLRIALQQGTVVRLLSNDDAERAIISVGDAAEAQAATRALLAGGGRPTGWGDRWIIDPLGGRVAQEAFDRDVAPGVVALAGLGLAAAALISAGMGWPSPALALLILALLASRATDRMAAVSLSDGVIGGLSLFHRQAFAFGVALVAILFVARDWAMALGQWGIGLAIVMTVVLLAMRLRLAPRGPAWWLDAAGMKVTLLIGGVIGFPLVGAMLALVQALAALIMAIEEVKRAANAAPLAETIPPVESASVDIT